MAEPFIKIYRKMLEWEWYDDLNTFKLFIHCLLKANWQETQWHGVTIQPGQFITSLSSLSRETHLTIKQVRTALAHLQTTGEIASECYFSGKVGANERANKGQAKFRIITVIKWDDYQSKGKPTDEKGQHGGNLGATVKEKEEDKEGEEDNIQDFDPDIKNPDVIYKAICSFYNETCISMIKVKTLTENRMRILRDGLRVHTLDDYKELFRLADESKFLRGEVTNFKADFDWLIAPEHMTRILEGKYNERSDNGNNGTGDFEADEEQRLRELDEYLASDEFRENDRSPFE